MRRELGVFRGGCHETKHLTPQIGEAVESGSGWPIAKAMTCRGGIIGLFLVATCPALSWADPAEDLQELGLSEMGYPQEEGELQATVISRLTREDEEESLGLNVGVELGLTDDLQLEVMVPLRFGLGADAEAEVEQVELGVGWRVLDRGGFSVMPILEVGVLDDWVFEPKVVLHQYFGAWHANLDLGLELEGEESAAFEAGLAAYAAFGAWTPVAELRAELQEGEVEFTAAAGLAWRPAEGYEVVFTGFAGLDGPFGSFGGALTCVGEWELADDDDDEQGPST